MKKSIFELDTNFKLPVVEDGLAWCNLSTLEVEGLGWPEESDAFCRLPNRAHQIQTMKKFDGYICDMSILPLLSSAKCRAVWALGWREGLRYLPLQDDISNVAFWYQILPVAPFPALSDNDYLEII